MPPSSDSHHNDSDDHFQEYISQLHSSFVTPDDVISQVVFEATSHKLILKERIIAGESNEVYDCTVSDSSHVIVRIAYNDFGEFNQEQWAMKQCEKVGVPVPEILLIRQEKIEKQMRSLCVMEKVEGEPLYNGSIDFSKLSQDDQKKYMRQAGEILSKIHSVKTDGWGWIGQGCTSQFMNFESYFEHILKNRLELGRAAIEHGFSLHMIDSAFDRIATFKNTYRTLHTSINHGDYGNKHFMVKDQKIISIIDWGGVRSDSPMYDFANWDFWFGDDIPTQWLIEGYSDKSLFDTSFEENLHIFRLLRGIDVLHWYYSQRYKPAIVDALTKIKKDVQYFA